MFLPVGGNTLGVLRLLRPFSGRLIRQRAADKNGVLLKHTTSARVSPRARIVEVLETEIMKFCDHLEQCLRSG